MDRFLRILRVPRGPRQHSIALNVVILVAVKLAGGFVPAGEVTWEGDYTAPAFSGRTRVGDGKGHLSWVSVRIVVQDANTIHLTGFNVNRTYKRDRENKVGIQLFMAASAKEGKAYDKNSMTCDRLVSQASAEIGVRVVTTPFSSGTVTKSWFDHGMGPEFIQIAGGDTGIPLAELVAKEAADQIIIPIGSVIVADGHAALFDGEAIVGKERQMMLLDANDSDGWTISLDGRPSRDDPDDKMIKLPGHQVGYHVTRLQWGANHLVKVFQPIGH